MELHAVRRGSRCIPATGSYPREPDPLVALIPAIPGPRTCLFIQSIQANRARHDVPGMTAVSTNELHPTRRPTGPEDTSLAEGNTIPLKPVRVGADRMLFARPVAWGAAVAVASVRL